VPEASRSSGECFARTDHPPISVTYSGLNFNTPAGILELSRRAQKKAITRRRTALRASLPAPENPAHSDSH